MTPDLATHTVSAPGITLTLYQCARCTQRTPLTYFHAPTNARYCQSCVTTILAPTKRPWR